MNGRQGLLAIVVAAAFVSWAGAPATAEPPAPSGRGSLADRSVQWPTWNQWRRLLLLEDYNTRVVVLGTSLLGLAAGTIGSFTLLRRRALMGDALSHATLPGLALAFVVGAAWGTGGKSLPWLLTGAAASGLVGVATILLIRNLSRVKEDAALGVVLSVFFGLGIAMLGLVQQMRTGYAAGLEAFIYGKTASMVASDAWLIGTAGLACAAISGLLFKELRLLCFDEGFAASRGFPTVALDLLLMAMVVVVTIIGLEAVGLVLMIAFLVTPAAAARFWTQRMTRMTWLSALLGAASGLVGSAMSAILPRLPSGAMIVLVATGFFLFSMIFGSARGILVRGLRRYRLNAQVDRRHLLRGIYEFLEGNLALPRDGVAAPPPVDFRDLLQTRSWSAGRLRREVARARRAGLVEAAADDELRLTARGLKEAARLVREHRLWEIYLTTHADIATSQVDRDADTIEHVLEPGMIAKLEGLLAAQQTAAAMPKSVHPIQAAAPSSPANAQTQEP
jgi:manganese/zinc/iron transport system permease protein